MGGYAVRLLGPPELRRDGSPVPLGSRKALALTAYLTLEARPCTRDTLAALLWPDSAPEVARSALRNTLSQLRTVLDNRLAISKQTVALTWTDVDELDVSRLRAGDPDAWQDEFLEGLHTQSEAFETWLTGQREALRAQADRAFDGRSAALLDDSPGAAAELVTRWLSLDRLNEAAWRRLILARLAAGQTSPAREAFESCRAVLSGELGVSPAPETLALEARLRPQAAPAPAELPAFLVGGPLVGRQAEFGRLVGAYRLAASGTPQALLISGEPGIGKTRLAGELLAWARERGAPLLRGRALESASAPFAPLSEALRREVATLRARLDTASRADLARLLPELHDGPPPKATGDLKAQTLTALSAAFLALAPLGPATDPLVLFVDDLQWTDASSQEALLHLAAQLAECPAPVLLLLTARSEYLGTGSPLSGWLAKLRRQLPLHEEHLGPLDAGGSDALLASSLPRLPERVRTRLTDWLYVETAGHPLYLTETVKGLLESGAVKDGQLDEARLPHGAAGVRAAIGERLARLGPASLALAQGSAVLGQGAAFETLRGVADLDPETALMGYEELLRTGLLLEHGEQATLSHDRVRETLRDALSGPRRQLLHGRAFRVLEKVDAPPAVLAGHALNGGMTDEAAVWFERSGDAANEVGANEEVIFAYQMVLDLIAKDRNKHHERYIIFEAILTAMIERDDGIYKNALSYSINYINRLSINSPEDLAMAKAEYARLLINIGELDEALEVLISALEISANIENSIRCMLYKRCVFANTCAWNWVAARRALQEYERLADPSKVELLVIEGESIKLAITAASEGYAAVFEQQKALAKQAMLEYRKTNLPRARRDYIVRKTIGDFYTSSLTLGTFSEAISLINTAKTIVETNYSSLFFQGLIGIILLHIGDNKGALPYLQNLVENQVIYGRASIVFSAYLCENLVLLDRKLDAENILRELNLRNLKQANKNQFCVTSSLLGNVYFMLEDYDTALIHYQDALLSHEQSFVLSALRGLGQVLKFWDEPQATAYCIGAVLGNKNTWLRDRQLAEATLADLRTRFPASEIEAALAEGAATPLKEVVQRVRAELAAHVPEASTAN